MLSSWIPSSLRRRRGGGGHGGGHGGSHGGGSHGVGESSGSKGSTGGSVSGEHGTRVLSIVHIYPELSSRSSPADSDTEPAKWKVELIYVRQRRRENGEGR